MRGNGGDSSCETAMPSRKNVPGGVDVTVVYRSTFAASPFFCRISDPTSQAFQAFRASVPVTATTDLGGIRFVDLLEPHACAIALALQHGPECTPACIENRFGLVHLRKGGGIHVANEERTVASNKPGAEFVMKVFSTVRNLDVIALTRPFLFARWALANCSSNFR